MSDVGLPGTSRVNVKAMRERLGLSQMEFAERLHVDERTIRRWEHGTSRPSPMAMAHMRTLRAPAPSEGMTSSAHVQGESVAQAMSASAEPTLPRRRIPTF